MILPREAMEGKKDNSVLVAERIESVKVGILAGLSVGLVFAIAMLANQLILARHFDELTRLQISSLGNLLLSGAIACLSGSLFGITYRYIIREDRNSHLNDGAVLAFGLVRGLAQVDLGLNFQLGFWSFAILAIESILLFAIARFILDSAIGFGWIKPFKSN